MKKIRLREGLFIGILAAYFVLMIVLKAGAADSVEYHIKGIEESGVSFEELKIPLDVKVVGIGEATHGNAEFQTAKLNMLKKLVESGKCHSIAFEMSAGEAAFYSAAIHETETDLGELLRHTDYPIYDTEQILELLQWMRNYNTTHREEESLMFYGVDMQGNLKEIAYLNKFCKEHEEDFTEAELDMLADLAAEEEPETAEERDFFEKLNNKLEEHEEAEYKVAAYVAKALVQWIDAPSFSEDANAYGLYRDNCMAENLKSYYELEAKRGYPQILITAHNGHVMKGDTEGYGEVPMGSRINDLFEGSYYCVGTDFYNTCVNIHTAGTYDEEYERADHEYCSENPLAYQAKFFDDGIYCLDFASVTDSGSPVYKLIHTMGFTGAAGEGYNQMMDFYKTYRYRMIVTDHYDAMIYYYETTPIRVRNY